MEQDLRIIIDLLQAQRNDAHNIACNHMLEGHKLRMQNEELTARIKELEDAQADRSRCISEGQLPERIESSGQGQSSKEDKHSKSKI